VATFLISGASGFIGSRLGASLVSEGHRVVPLTHSGGGGDAVSWDAEAGEIDAAALARVAPDVVVNLAGARIDQRWTASAKRRIHDSRVNGTTALARALARLPRKPAVLVNASAVGYYGAHRGDDLLDEDSAAGSDFLGATCVEWERATAAASDAGIRVAMMRSGVVVGEGGGFLARLMPVFKAGIGGRVGDGRHWLSWIAMDDMIRAIRFLIESDVRGALNVVSPEPVRNDEFTRALSRVLHRPALLPVPRVALELLYGTMADSTVLASQRAIPKRLAGAGFVFRHPRMEDALRFELRR